MQATRVMAAIRTVAARLWQKLRIVRRYLLKIYKITHRIR